jgi:hypothetical protein
LLQAPQDLCDVIAGLRIQPNGRDVLLAELQLGIDDLTHGGSNDEVDEGSFARHRVTGPTARLRARRRRAIKYLQTSADSSGTIGTGRTQSSILGTGSNIMFS